jgi:hypothetical protein
MENIQVHMSDVTLNEYSDEDISDNRLFETPPHIPVERVSLTSEDPDLELVFDDVRHMNLDVFHSIIVAMAILSNILRITFTII